MAAIISDKFRIFNAKQFLESLSEGSSDTGSDRTRMYFFVGRPQAWNSYLEIYSANATAFTAGQFVYVSTDTNGSYTWANAPFKASIVAVYENSLILSSISPSTSSTPLPNSVVEGWNGASDTGAEARAGVYRFATEDTPPTPLDHQSEKFDVYAEIIAAKRITDSFARGVITRYDWNTLAAEPRFDMYKPDYTATTTGQIGKLALTNAASLATAKYYVINSNYEVFKCLYNGEFPGRTSPNPQYEPKTSPSAGQGTYNGNVFTEGGDLEVSNTAGYAWKYMYTIPTDDVLRFLSTNFLPINLPSESTRAAVQSAAIEGAVSVVLVEEVGAGLPNGTHYAPINGDGQLAGGTEAVVEIVVASNAIQSAKIVTEGAGYTYGSVNLADGVTVGGIKTGLFTTSALTTGRTGVSGTGALEVIIAPEGGHGADMESEFGAKRVMTNIRLTYAEGSGDFPVDNDFRRIGIIKDPYNYGTTDFATNDTRNGLFAVKIENATADYNADEEITQALSTGGTAKGTVVSWTLDSGSTTAGVLKYIQVPGLHAENGVVREFDSSAAVVGTSSLASGTVDQATTAVTLLGVSFTNGQGNPEIEANSGDVIYVENRRLITRAPDQIEDIKLVIEF